MSVTHDLELDFAKSTLQEILSGLNAGYGVTYTPAQPCAHPDWNNDDDGFYSKVAFMEKMKTSELGWLKIHVYVGSINVPSMDTTPLEESPLTVVITRSFNSNPTSWILFQVTNEVMTQEDFISVCTNLLLYAINQIPHASS